MNETMKDRIVASVDAIREELDTAADAIWETPEINFRETRSADILKGLLRRYGFAVTEGLDGMPTAFRAEFGSGKPVIGFLGEYDALSAMSQKEGIDKREALCPGEPGHGCGHNLLGTGSAGAAIAVSKMIAAGELQGTVVYMGCPAEETGSAKTFLARDGYFEGFDAFLSWHPWDYTGVWPGGSLANVKLIFKFTGQSAHAAGSPHLGRSALDALELMNTGVQFLREHVPQDTRIHYAITDAGGTAPNVVQAHAQAVYLVRSPRLEDLSGIYNRVIDCAKGAAIMTGTSVEVQFVKGCSNVLPNHVIGRTLQACMETIGHPAYTEEETAFAAKLHASLEAPERSLDKIAPYCTGETRRALLAHKGEPMYGFITPFCETDDAVTTISTDVGDASWSAPTSQIFAAAWAADTPAHTWQVVSIGKSGIAHKAAAFAASTLALCAAKLMSEPELLKEAKAEFESRLAVHPYDCPIPKDVPLPM